MKENIKISCINCEVDDSAKKYAKNRVSALYKYLPRHAKKSVFTTVKLEEIDHDHGNKYMVEIIMDVPGKVLTAKDSTSNMIAAIDIVEAKLKMQILSYKQAAVGHIARHGVMSRFKRRVKNQ